MHFKVSSIWFWIYKWYYSYFFWINQLLKKTSQTDWPNLFDLTSLVIFTFNLIQNQNLIKNEIDTRTKLISISQLKNHKKIICWTCIHIEILCKIFPLKKFNYILPYFFKYKVPDLIHFFDNKQRSELHEVIRVCTIIKTVEKAIKMRPIIVYDMNDIKTRILLTVF